VNNTTFPPTFPPPFGTWYSRYAFIYNATPPASTLNAEVTDLPVLPRLTSAA
jgi:hypothetical protein